MTTPFCDLTAKSGLFFSRTTCSHGWSRTPLSSIRRPLCLTFSWLLGKDGPSPLFGSGRALSKPEISSPTLEWRLYSTFLFFWLLQRDIYLLCLLPYKWLFFSAEWPKRWRWGGRWSIKFQQSTPSPRLIAVLLKGLLDDGLSWSPTDSFNHLFVILSSHQFGIGTLLHWYWYPILGFSRKSWGDAGWFWNVGFAYCAAVIHFFFFPSHEWTVDE